MLRHHIQSRPNREYLVGQNILHGDGHVDFRIAARQKELKKCRLAENLNQHLITRPGPLDLVDRNILQAPQQLHLALRAGLLPVTCSSNKNEEETSKEGIDDQGTGQYYHQSMPHPIQSPAVYAFDPVIASGTTVVNAPTTTEIPMILSSDQPITVISRFEALAFNVKLMCFH